MARVKLKGTVAALAVVMAGLLSACAGGGGGDNGGGTTLSAPAVLLTSPVNNATGVPLTTPIAVAFSKVMQPAAFTSTTFTVTASNGASVNGSFSYTNGYATFAPDSSLAYNTLYTATISAGVQAADGSALAAGYSWSFTTQPQGGAVDTSFTSGAGVARAGVVTTQVSPAHADEIRAVATQPDGKIVAVGYAVTGADPAADVDFAVVRYDASGNLDATFGTDGIVITDTTLISQADEARAVAIQGDGKIVVAGVAVNGPSADFVVARYNENGTLDTSFGTNGNGVVFTDFGDPTVPDGEVAFAVAIDASQRIVVAGKRGGPLSANFAVARYDTHGVLDTTFGGTGKVITPVVAGFDEAHAVAIQADGKIVVAGVADGIAAAGINYDFALARYNVDGSLDTGFGANGIVITPGSGEESIYTLDIQTDGNIVVAGSIHSGTNNDFGLARYTGAGVLDATFGTGGTVITDMAGGNDVAFAVAIQTDGKIVAGGAAFVTGQGDDFAVARYNTNGQLDTAGFGVQGRVITMISAADDRVYGLALQNDGKILLAGSSGTGGNASFALVRYFP